MKYTCFITLLFTLLCTGVRAQCPPGNVEINNDAELATFLNDWPDCTELNGSLNLQGNVTTTGGLKNIVYIPGTLTIRNAPISDLDGLIGLVQVDGDVGLVDLDFTADLASMPLIIENIGGELVIRDNPNLKTINLLGNLENVDRVTLTNNPELSNLSGLDGVTINSMLSITNNIALSDCAAGGVCNALSLPAEDVTISGNAGNCANFFEVQADCLGTDCPPDITVTTNQEIADFVNAFPNCVNLAGDLNVSDGATNFGNFDLETVGGDVRFSSLANNNLDRFELTSVGGDLTFVGMTNLVSSMANGPLPLTSVGGTIQLWNLPTIENVAALQNVTTLGGLTLIFCDMLDDLNDWQDVPLTGTNLQIQGMNNILNLDILDPLDIDGVEFEFLRILSNPLLEEISGIANVGDIGTLSIQLNPSLDYCAVDAVCSAVINGGTALFFLNNAQGCNSTQEVKATCTPDLDALIDLYNATDGPNWTNNTGWAAAAAGNNCTPCDGTWHGITCDANERVTEITLASNQLTGSIPSSIGQLSQLDLLSFTNNNLTGTIPDEIFSLPLLKRLFLTINNLTGGIPSSIGNAPVLEQCIFAGNPDLGGSIPSEITQVTTLRTLGAAGCALTGTLPVVNDGDLPNLKWLLLSQNNLSGNFSANYGFLIQLERIELNDNNFTGLVPSIFASLPNLAFFHIENNDFINGLPANLNAATSLEELKVSNNNLNGFFRPNLRDLVSLEIFEVDGNGFTGEAPAFDQSPNLAVYNVADNDLDGLVPNALLNSTVLTDVLLNDNAFIGPLPSFPANSSATLEELNAANNNFAGCYPTEYEDLCSVTTDFSGNEGLPDGGSAASFTTDFCQGNDACGSLPVNWLGITAAVAGKAVRVNWTTSAEENNEDFRVERSADGRAWGQVGIVSAGGHAYEFIDEAPLAGTSFYRVRQVDFNGAEGLSPVATVRFSAAAAAAFPNPFNDRLTVYSEAPDQVLVYDANGREVLQYMHLGGGAQVQRLVLKSGVYFLRLRSSGTVIRVIAR